MRFFAITAFAFGLIGSTAAAQSLDCGKPPELPLKYQETEKLKGELDGKGQMLSKLVGNVDLKGAIEAERNTIYQSADQVLTAWQAGYLSYVFCASVMSEKSLTTQVKINAWLQFQQAMQPPKIGATGPAGIFIGPGSSHVTTQGNTITGYQNGIVDLGSNDKHIDNHISGPPPN